VPYVVEKTTPLIARLSWLDTNRGEQPKTPAAAKKTASALNLPPNPV